MNIYVSVQKDWGIGLGDKKLFSLKQDKIMFNQTTFNKVVIFGSNTFSKLLKNTPFKNRINICLSKDKSLENEGVVVATDLQDLFEKVSFYSDDNVFVIGGETTFNQLLPYCKKVYVTKIDYTKQADKFFANLDADPNWTLVKTTDPVYEDGIVYYFCEYENKKLYLFNYGFEEDDLV